MNYALVFLSIILTISSAYASSSREELARMILERAHPSIGFYSTHSVVFFFASSCPHCHRQAPIIKEWAHTHQATLDAYSLDHKPIPDFQTPLVASRQLIDVAFKGQSIRYPALFILNTSNGVLYPVAFGALNRVELAERMQQIMIKIKSYEMRGQS